VSANSSFETGPSRAPIWSLAAPVRCWKKIHDVWKESASAVSSDAWYILMPVQIVCNPKIFLS
jgi:hypothetical protein